MSKMRSRSSPRTPNCHHGEEHWATYPSWPGRTICRICQAARARSLHRARMDDPAYRAMKAGHRRASEIRLAAALGISRSALRNRQVSEGTKKKRSERVMRRKQQYRTIAVNLLYQRDGDICAECGQVIERKDAQIDHKRPKHLGGDDRATNMRLLHSWCNLNRTYEEYQSAPILRSGNAMSDQETAAVRAELR
jgi:5-methylcytosine-specific restriction endonuclease McrA